MVPLRIGLFSVLFIFFAGGSLSATEEEDFYVAQKALTEGFYEAAEKLFEDFIIKYPQSRRKDEARLFIGKSLFYKESFEEAEAVLSKLAESASSPHVASQALHWLGEINYQAKKYRKAVAFFEEVRDKYPGSFIFWWSTYSLGFSYLELGESKQAESIFTDIINNAPSGEVKDNAFNALCKNYYENKKYNKLRQISLSWLEEFPDTGRKDHIYFYLGEVSHSFKEYSKALEYYQEALGNLLDADLEDSIYQGLGWTYLDLDNLDEAKEWFLKISSEEIRFYSLGSLYFKMKNYDDAYDYFDKFIKNFTQSPFLYKTYLGMAESLYNLGRINDAMSYYRKLVKDKDFIEDRRLIEETYYGLAWCYLKINDYKKAIEEFRKLTIFSEEPIIKTSAQINIGDVYQESGQFQKALGVYEKVLEEFPGNLYSDYIQLQIGLCLLKQEDLEASLLAFENLKRSFPQSKLRAEAVYYTALSLASLGNLKESAIILEDFIRGFPKDSLIKDSLIKKMYLLLIQVYIDAKDYSKVTRAFKEVGKRFAGDKDFSTRIQIQKGLFHLDQGQDDIAKSVFARFLKEYPDSEFKDRVLLYLAHIYHKEENYPKARLYYQKIIEGSPQSSCIPQARLDLAQILWDEAKFQEAEDLLKKNFSSSSSDVVIQAKIMLVEFMLSRGRLQRAIDICDNLIEEFPDSRGFFYFRKAKIYEDKEDYQKAYDNFLKAQKSEFDSPSLRFSKGYVLEKMGRIEEAIKSFFDAIFVFPKDEKNMVKSYLRIAKLYERLGQLEEAGKAYQKIIDMEAEEAKYALERLEELNKRVESRE